MGAVIGVDEVLADRTPADKLDAVRAEQRRAPTIMVGDGINDAPALALADVGVAMGARGATASSEAADAVLTVDHLDRLGEVAALARRTQRIAWQSVVAGMGLSLAAMGVAAAGLLPALWGALLQELIDVAVILNALRALHPATAGVRLAAEDAALTRRFQAEHESIRVSIGRLRTAADALGSAPPAAAMEQVRQVHELLTGQIGPHEKAEEQELYPALDRLFGNSDVTATMSRAHAEIAHQIRRLGQLLDDIGPGEPDDLDLADLRGLLYGLHAILRLHTAQEDESYLSLGEDAPAPDQLPLDQPAPDGAAPGPGSSSATMAPPPGRLPDGGPASVSVRDGARRSPVPGRHRRRCGPVRSPAARSARRRAGGIPPGSRGQLADLDEQAGAVPPGPRARPASRPGRTAARCRPGCPRPPGCDPDRPRRPDRPALRPAASPQPHGRARPRAPRSRPAAR